MNSFLSFYVHSLVCRCFMCYNSFIAVFGLIRKISRGAVTTLDTLKYSPLLTGGDDYCFGIGMDFWQFKKCAHFS